MEVISVAIAALSLLVSALALWDSHRRATSAQADAERAVQAAVDSAAAAVRSADAAEEHVELLRADATRYEVPWHVTLAGKARYLLENMSSSETAHEVTITLDGYGRLDDEQRGFDIGPASSREFFATLPSQSNRQIVVHWKRPNGEEHSWRTTLR